MGRVAGPAALTTALWQNRLRPGANRQMTTRLTTYILLAGLMTTSTYPATYSAAVSPDQHGGNTFFKCEACFAWYRVLNQLSFYSSLATILGSVLLIVQLQSYPLQEDGGSAWHFTQSSAKRLEVLHRLTTYSLLVCLAAPFAAITLGALVFDQIGSAIASLCLVVIVLIVCASMMCLHLACEARQGQAPNHADEHVQNLLYNNPVSQHDCV